VSDPTPKSTCHNSDANAGLEPTLDSVAAPEGVSAPDLGWIGPYRLIRKLGEGGMGQVWLAEQSAPVKRQVALKIIKAGRYDDSALLRFNVERQTLAIMDHPAIAKVFDAGSTPQGQPYFVMEYVPGLPITKYGGQKHLSVQERLALFIKVCEGVQHAHQKAMTHRDLKPSNILVVDVDGKPVPRIIDFGIAKAMSHTEDETLVTRAGGMVGTPGYMSPEQADPSVLDVDTRTDVYSLGVVLYELLTGELPFDAKQWQTRPFHEVLRQLHEEDPQRPSTRVSTDSRGAAKNSRVDPHKLVRQLRGDLDCIALKALEHERERRYSSPSDLAADLNRYLRDEPITARPPSVSYRTRKFVRRNRVAVAFTAALVFIIVGFAVSMTMERNRAQREAETSRRVSDFMTQMFTVSDPGVSRGNTVTAREILDKASEQIEKGLGQDPQVQARLMQTMGTTYRGLGLDEQAHRLLEHALAIQTQTLGPDNPETLRSLALLGIVVEGQGRFADSEKLLRQALAGQQRVLGPDHPETMQTVSSLTDTLDAEGHLAEAEGLLRRTIANQQRTLGPENRATLRSMRSLTGILRDQGHFAEAEKFGRETLRLEQHALGPDHPGTLWSMNQLALTLQQEGRYIESEKLFRETLAVETRVLGPDHDNTRAALANLGLTLLAEGRLTEAEALQREELARTRKAAGPDHPNTLESLGYLAITLGKEHKLEESERLLRDSVEIGLRTVGPVYTTRIAMGNLAITLAYEKRADQSIALFEKLMAYASKSEGTAMMDANYQYAVGLSILGRKDQAFEHLQEAVKLGFENTSQLTTDDDLKPLHDDPRFQALLDEIQRKQPVASK
jgi:serine/threonine protein kinase/tetratricopeptide (TPR) repeat protein